MYKYKTSISRIRHGISRSLVRNYRFPQVALESTEAGYSRDFVELAHVIRSGDLVDGLFGAWQEQFDSELTLGTRNFGEVVNDLIGVRGMDRPTANELLYHLDFLSGPSNPYFSVRQIISDFNKSAHLKLTDLGSTCDVTVLKDILNHRRARVLEIGGGYGRLAEALLRNSGAKLQIDMLDVIPSSLALAKSYLSQSGVSVNLLQELSSSNVDVNLHLPSTVESIPDGSVDLAINVESFQEMTQDWVDYWIKIIDKKTRVGSFFYQSNAFQYRNFFKLSLDSKWFLEKSIRHPRHWTQGHRTEIWRRIN